MQKYLDGVNAFIQTRAGEYPWNSSWRHQAQTLGHCRLHGGFLPHELGFCGILKPRSSPDAGGEGGPEKAQEIFPLNINPDDEVKGKPFFKYLPSKRPV